MPIRSLGYLRWRTPDVEQWSGFATDVLGLMPAEGPDPALRYFRMDDRPYRLVLVAGETPGIDAVGFEVGDDRELAAVGRDLEEWGAAVDVSDRAEADRHLVSGLARWTDPSRVPVELYYGPILDHRPIVTPLVSSFVTGDLGMGHVVLGSVAAVDAVNVYRNVLGMHCRNTMRLQFAPDAPPITMWFLGCNPRHHTVGLIGAEWPGTLAHFMVEVATIDDVGLAYERCLDGGVPIAMTLGRHTNDQMLSFYCVAPDGVQVEVGYGGVRLDGPQSPTTYEITKVSTWGHRPPA